MAEVFISKAKGAPVTNPDNAVKSNSPSVNTVSSGVQFTSSGGKPVKRGH